MCIYSHFQLYREASVSLSVILRLQSCKTERMGPNQADHHVSLISLSLSPSLLTLPLSSPPVSSFNHNIQPLQHPLFPLLPPSLHSAD